MKYSARCHCGAVRYEVCADPVDAKICHCKACQVLHGAPMQWAAIFRKDDVRFTAGLDEFDPELNDEGDILVVPGVGDTEWVRGGSLVALTPTVLWGESPAWSLQRFQLHLSIGQAF